MGKPTRGNYKIVGIRKSGEKEDTYCVGLSTNDYDEEGWRKLKIVNGTEFTMKLGCDGDFKYKLIAMFKWGQVRYCYFDIFNCSNSIVRIEVSSVDGEEYNIRLLEPVEYVEYLV